MPYTSQAHQNTPEPGSALTNDALPLRSINTERLGGWIVTEIEGEPEAVEAYVRRFLHDHGWARDGHLVNRADDGTSATLKRWHRC